MLRVNIRLSDVYGAAFPRYNEADHLIALRGLLILWIKNARDKMMDDLSYDLQDAIDHVSDILERDYRYDLKRHRVDAPRDLFEHYLFVVSKHWVPLAALRA